MTTLYRPVLIESAEQAEALPIGMVLIREGHYTYQKGDGAPGSDYVDGGPETAIGWTALVPIEAEEVRVIESGRIERDVCGCTVLEPSSDAGSRDYRRTEYRTAWEEA